MSKRKGSELAKLGNSGFFYDKSYLLKDMIDISVPEEFNALLGALRTPGIRRSEAELNFIARFYEKDHLFQMIMKEMNHQAILDLCVELKYEYAGPGTVIFNYGELGRKWYNIVKGEVSILVPSISQQILATEYEITPSHQKGGGESPDHNNRPKWSKQRVCEGESDEKRTIIRFEDGHALVFDGFRIANRLRDAASFGEIALQLGVPR